ncbi:MAG: FecR domain-containing protein [Anaerolineaceae bacterium]|nr:FecR domain-containing protein [Anaerolineaceae bacterium]
MNDLDALLQERLEQVEQGAPVTVAGGDLPEDMADLLALTAELRAVPMPEPDETAVLAQRTAVLQAARQQLAVAEPAADAAAPAWLVALLAWWRAHQVLAWGATAVAAVLLILFVGGLLNREAESTPAVAEQDEDRQEAAEPEDSASDGPSLLDRLFGRDEAEVPPTVVAESTTAPASEAVTGEEGPGYELYLPVLTESLETGPQTAALGDLQGVVSVQQPDGSWAPVSSLSSVAAGSRVRTGALSKASLTFFDGSVAKLGPDSELSIDTLNALRPEEGFRTVVLTQWRGDSTHDVQFRNDSGSQYEVKSPSGTGVARGTTFQVIVLPDLTSRYTVLEGRVDVTNINVTVVVLAGQLTTILNNLPPTQPVFHVSGEGEVTAVGPTWTIGGQTFATDEQTIIVGNPQVGDWVMVQGHLLDDGTKVADRIVLVRQVSQNEFALTAVVTEMGADQWRLGSVIILLNDATVVDPAIALNDWVRVTGVVQADGSLLARDIRRIAPDGTPFEFTGVVQNIGAETWLISGITVAVNGRTEIDDDLDVGEVARVEGIILPHGTWLAREINDRDDDDEVTRFEFTGLVETIDPWLVAGIALSTDEWTEIDTAVAPGDRVRVEGIILPDGTWLAAEIRLLDDTINEGIIVRFTGVLTSRDPWVVNGITLYATDDSHIDEDVVVGTLVQVVARLTEDGQWEIVWLRPLLPPTSGCFTINTQIISVNGSQIVLANWPTLTLDDDVQIDGNLAPNTIIALNLCLGDDDTVIVINIVVIQIIINNPPPPSVGNDDDNGGSGSGQITICHVPSGNPSARHTITVGISAWENEHSRHGDTIGPCGQGDHDDDDDDDD